MKNFREIAALGAPFENVEIQVSLRKQTARIVIEIEPISETKALNAYMDLPLLQPIGDSFMGHGIEIAGAVAEAGLADFNNINIVDLDSLARRAA